MKFIVVNMSHDAYIGSFNSETLLDATGYFVDKLVEDGELDPQLQGYSINPITEDTAEIEVVNAVYTVNYLITKEIEI